MNDRVQQDTSKSDGKEEFILIISTANNSDEAKKLAELIVKEQAAACVSVSSPVLSVYRWKSNVETEKEVMLFIKTVKNNYQRVEQLIIKNHSYEVPEIIALPITQGEERYLQWILDNTKT